MNIQYVQIPHESDLILILHQYKEGDKERQTNICHLFIQVQIVVSPLEGGKITNGTVTVTSPIGNTINGTKCQKRKDKRSDIVFKTKPKRFGIVPELVFQKNRLFRFGPESALLDQIEMISFEKTNSGTNSNVLVSFLLDIGTFVERLFLYCFDMSQIPRVNSGQEMNCKPMKSLPLTTKIFCTFYQNKFF